MSFDSKWLQGIRCALMGLVLGAAGAHASGDGMPEEWVAKWTEDLRTAKQACEEMHPAVFHALDEESWNAEFDALIGRLPSLQHHEVAVELARIIARLEDGHTRLTLPLGPGIEFMQGHSTTPDPLIPELLFHQFPVRFVIDSRGVFIQQITDGHAEVVGARVREIGHLDTDAAIDAVAPTIRRDNEQQVLHHLPMHLVLAEVLHARGVIETLDRLPLEVELPGGERRHLDLDVVPHGTSVSWADARLAADSPELPLYRRQSERNFWLRHMPDRRTVYLQFNEVYDDPDETLRDFADRVGTFLDAHDVANLIVDLRRNRGGNQGLARPLLHSIICSEVNRTGNLFVLVGRTTFSAAMLFALSLETHTNAVFVGEPTGSRPNHYGDSRKVRLPNTGLTVRVSTRYWQNDPTDVRLALAPHIPAEITAEDERLGRDPAMNAVLDIIDSRQRGTDSGIGVDATSWTGFISDGLNTDECRFDVTDPSGMPAVRIRIPPAELDRVAHDVRVDGGAIHFAIDWDDTPVTFAGHASGRWLIGEGEYQTIAMPFVLQRVE